MDVVLHIGVHRTGTTSIQQALADHRDSLPGFTFPVGNVLADNHVELALVAMRPERLDDAAPFFNWALAQLDHAIRDCRDPRWVPLTHDWTSRQGPAVYSCEGLSYLRHDDEIDRLLACFPGATVSVVMFTRDPATFLPSYRWSMQILGMGPSTDPSSIAYTEPDSWLVDYDSRVARWRAALGDDAVTVFDYDECLDKHGSTVPPMMELLGVDVDPSRYWLNRRL